jgi:hypothetical protein
MQCMQRGDEYLVSYVTRTIFTPAHDVGNEQRKVHREREKNESEDTIDSKEILTSCRVLMRFGQEMLNGA